MKTKFLSGLAESLRLYMDKDADWYSYLWNKLRNPEEGNDSRNYSASQEFASYEGFWIKMCRWDGGEGTIPAHILKAGVQSRRGMAWEQRQSSGVAGGTLSDLSLQLSAKRASKGRKIPLGDI